MNKIIKRIGALVLTLFIALSGLVIYAMSGMSASTLVLCSANEGGIYIPGRVCEFYLKTYRSGHRDIEELAIGGLDPILNLSNDSKKYELATFFIGKGLDVNGVNHYNYGQPMDLTPLHAGILAQDVKRIQFLIEHGADTTLVSSTLDGKTPLEYAKSLYFQKNTEELEAIVKLLSPKI